MGIPKLSIAPVVLLTAIAIPVHATVTTIGDVDPGGTATQPDPWAIDGTLEVGDSGNGTLSITAGGVVSNTWGSIAWSNGSTGEVIVAVSGSQWNNSNWLQVG